MSDFVSMEDLIFRLNVDDKRAAMARLRLGDAMVDILPMLHSALWAADKDIMEHLQVCKYNLRGEMNTGEIIERPNPPLLVHEAGIRGSEIVRDELGSTLRKIRQVVEAALDTTGTDNEVTTQQ